MGNSLSPTHKLILNDGEEIINGRGLSLIPYVSPILEHRMTLLIPILTSRFLLPHSNNSRRTLTSESATSADSFSKGN